MSAITTRDIARAAGVSGGVLYNYFTDKNDLLLSALVRRFSRLITDLSSGHPLAGTATVAENLSLHAQAIRKITAQTLPMAAGLMTEPDLLRRFFDAVHSQPFHGPRIFRDRIAGYLTEERRLGRIADIDVDAAATLLVGAAVIHGLTDVFGGMTDSVLHGSLSEEISVLVHGLAPAATHTRHPHPGRRPPALPDPPDRLPGTPH